MNPSEKSDAFGPLLQKRLFIAARVPAEIKESVRPTLAKIKTTLAGREIHPKWVRPENYHVTLCFLGATVAEKIPALKDIMSEVATQHKAIQLDIKGLGCFPENRAARVLWAGISNTKELRALQLQLATALANKSVKLPVNDYAENSYVPHMTLARVKNPLSLDDIIGQFGRLSFGAFLVSDIVLYESQFINYNVTYTELFSAPLLHL